MLTSPKAMESMTEILKGLKFAPVPRGNSLSPQQKAPPPAESAKAEPCTGGQGCLDHGALEVGVHLPSNTSSICFDHGMYVASMSSFTDTDGGSHEITSRSNTSGDR